MDFLAPHVGQKVVLPLATGATRLVSFELEGPERARSGGPNSLPPGGPPYLCCWKDEEATEPKFYIPLRGCRIVNNITELGPCLYFIASTGEFEFQCPNRQVCARWMETLKGLGVSLLKFTDLYKLTEFIGEGSFAKVYIGRHLFTGEDVVIKAVDKKKVLESNVYTEIEVLRKVSHPYIMRLYAAYEQEDFVCLVLEYLRGGELFDYLSEKGPFSEDQARHAMRRILLALQAMHTKGIVHRDLKTENLIIEHPSNPASIKIIDFGLAATVGSQEMKMRCGSPGYVAPEILQDLPYGPKVDVFSSGIILYTLLAGFPPFRGQNVKDILKKNLRCQLSFSHQRWAGIPHSVKDLIGWMCCKQPAKRCAAVQALTHPWFQRIARPLSKAAAATTAAAEQSDRETNLQHLQHQQREREPLALKAGGRQADSIDLLDKGFQGLHLLAKDTVEASKGPSFFNSAPPGAPGVPDARSEIEKQYNMESTESQGDLEDLMPKQTRQQKTQAAVKAAAKALEAKEAAAARAAAKARDVSALNAPRQAHWTVDNQKERAHEEGRPEQLVSEPPEEPAYLYPEQSTATATAASATAGGLAAAAHWATMQQQMTTPHCGREEALFPHQLLDSSIALRASRAPLPIELCERLSSCGSDAPPSPQASEATTSEWGPPSAAPTEPPMEKPEDSRLAAQAAAIAAAAASQATGHRHRPPWLTERPPTSDSSGSTQPSPSAAMQQYPLEQLSLVLDLDLSDPLGGSSRPSPYGLFDDHCESISGHSSADPCGMSLAVSPGGPSTPCETCHATADTATVRAPNGALQPQAGNTNIELVFCSSGHSSADRLSRSRILPPHCTMQEEDWTGEQASPEAPPQEPPSEWQPHQDTHGLTSEELCPGAPQGVSKKPKGRATLRSPKAAEGSYSAGGAGATTHVCPHHEEAIGETNADNDEPTGFDGDIPQGWPYCDRGYSQPGNPLVGHLHHDGTGRGGRSVGSGAENAGPLPPHVRSPVAKRHEAQGETQEGDPNTQGPPRTVKMQAYKRLHSHHYLVSGTNEVIRGGSLPSGGAPVAMPPVNTPLRMPELGGSSQAPLEAARTLGGPRGPMGGAFSWRPSAVSGDTPSCSYEGPKALRPMARKSAERPVGGPSRGSSTADGSPPGRRRTAQPERFAMSYERPPPVRYSSSSTDSSGSSRSTRQHQQPFHALQSRLSEFIGLPVLSKMASALGAREWLKGRGRSQFPGDSPEENLGGEPHRDAPRNSKREAKDGRSNRALVTERGDKERHGPMEEV